MTFKEGPYDPSEEQMQEATQERVDEIIFEVDKVLDEGVQSKEECDYLLAQLDLAEMLTADKQAQEAIRDMRKDLKEL